MKRHHAKIFVLLIVIYSVVFMIDFRNYLNYVEQKIAEYEALGIPEYSVDVPSYWKTLSGMLITRAGVTLVFWGILLLGTRMFACIPGIHAAKKRGGSRESL